MKVLTIDDMGQYSRISANTDRRQYEPIIELAKVTELIPVVGDVIVKDIEALAQGGTDRPELRAFHKGYIIPFFSKAVEIRLIVEHGANWGREGIIQYNDSANQSVPISDAMRANMLKQCRSDLSVFQSYLTSRFNEVSGILDGVQYEQLDNVKAQPYRPGTVRAIGTGRTSKARRYE